MMPKVGIEGVKYTYLLGLQDAFLRCTFVTLNKDLGHIVLKSLDPFNCCVKPIPCERRRFFHKKGL